jgi:hypothetical protein
MEFFITVFTWTIGAVISEWSSLQSKMWFFTSLVLDQSLHKVSDKFDAQS